MQKTYCDRCEGVIEDTVLQVECPPEYTVYTDGRIFKGGQIDLCSPCYEGLKNYLNDKT